MAGLKLSAFDVIGPAMVGPSSSHTAGAVRLGFLGRQLLGGTPRHAEIRLHGSFAATGRGHATDRALLAGLLGCRPDDEAIPKSPECAQLAGMSFKFVNQDLGEAAHPNTVQFKLASELGELELTGASLGGGVIQVSEIDQHRTAILGVKPTLVCWHLDRPGFLSDITSLFAACGLNIATLSTTRRSRGGAALTVVETDDEMSALALNSASKIDGLSRQRSFLPLP